MTTPWAPVEYPTAIKLLKTALENGANFWDGVREASNLLANRCIQTTRAKKCTQGTHYGTSEANSLHLVRAYFEQYPEDADKVVLSIKGAFTLKDGPDNSPEGIRASVEEAIKVLPPSIKAIDIFQPSRVDPKVPIETSVQALAELVKEGKIRSVGLSEVSANTIRRAHAVHPISAVEIELSLFTTDPLHNRIVDTCHERELFPRT